MDTSSNVDQLNNHENDYSNEYVNNKNTKNNENIANAALIKYKFLKIWVGTVIIITIIYFIYWYFYYDVYPVSYYSSRRQSYLRNHTSAYPPPLVNFMDVPDVSNDKYVMSGQDKYITVEDLV